MPKNKGSERIGQARYAIDVVYELQHLATEDEAAAKLLRTSGHFRHAIYFYLQAIEKTVRSEIFRIVDPGNAFFRDYNRHHSLKMSFDFFAQIVSSDLLKRSELRERLDAVVSPAAQHEALNNGLRYPWFSERFGQHNVSDFDQLDADTVAGSLADLKQVLKEIERYR